MPSNNGTKKAWPQRSKAMVTQIAMTIRHTLTTRGRITGARGICGAECEVDSTEGGTASVTIDWLFPTGVGRSARGGHAYDQNHRHAFKVGVRVKITAPLRPARRRRVHWLFIC